MIHHHPRSVAAVPLLAALLVPLGCQTPGPAKSNADVPQAANQLTFPDDWLGVWRGTCVAFAPGRGQTMTFPMDLHIAPIAGSERMTWKLVYGEGEQRDVRAYELVTVDAAKGHYQIDEKNSIVIDSYLIGDSLWSQFAVQSSLITIKYDRVGGELLFELSSTQQNEPTITGGEGGIPEVSAYPVRAIQRATLERVVE